MNARSGLRLDELVRELPHGSELSGGAAVHVTGVRQDSRQVVPGDLFVARKGSNADGATFVEDAKRRGAVAVLTEEAFAPVGLPWVRVPDVRVGLAMAAAAVYGHPSFSLDLVGITGTNGKTTTAHLVRTAIDSALGRRACGLIGTVGHAYATLEVAATHTTPEADDLTRVLASMHDLGATHVAMEVSSIALSSRRVHAVRFRVAAFTNLTQDHLDFHGSMERYAAAKSELFLSHGPGVSVIHVGDAMGRELARTVKGPLLRVSAVVGARADEADVAPRSLELSGRGIEAIVRTPHGDVELVSPLFGAHNLENLLVTLGVVAALDLDVARAAEGLRLDAGAPGRLERCETPADDVVVLVDYAHTPDAIARVLSAVRALTAGRILLVFGCGGDRDRSKRRPMGEAAGRGADIIIVTNDNPRTEAPEDIEKPIAAGLSLLGLNRLALCDLSAVTRGYAVELDRGRAIEAAIFAARPGDTVVVCGKGHEDYQVIGTERVPFDDRLVAKAALLRRRGGL